MMMGQLLFRYLIETIFIINIYLYAYQPSHDTYLCTATSALGLTFSTDARSSVCRGEDLQNGASSATDDRDLKQEMNKSFIVYKYAAMNIESIISERKSH